MIKTIALVAMLAFSASLSAAETYEYKVISFNQHAAPASVETELNKLGQQGWRLVNVSKVIFNGSVVTFRHTLMRTTPHLELSFSND